MTNGKSRLDQFLHGTKWAQEYARKSLPVLVRWAEVEKANTNGQPVEYTYQKLAIAVGQPKHWHPIHEALGVLGFALQELETAHKKEFDKIPPIQLIVWSKGKGSPGDDGFFFLNIPKEQLKALSPEARLALASQVRMDILNYPHWRKVLDTFGLTPLTIDLPKADQIITSLRSDGLGGGEGVAHRRLKYFLGQDYSQLGIDGKFQPAFEQDLLSGDVADLILSETQGTRRICVEVKSRKSSENDLIRGIFQSVKYRAVLNAHEKYELARSPNYTRREIDVVLATECSSSDDLVDLSKRLGVRIIWSIVVPPGYPMSPNCP